VTIGTAPSPPAIRAPDALASSDSGIWIRPAISSRSEFDNMDRRTSIEWPEPGEKSELKRADKERGDQT
jgi:hypothetical protein